MGNDFDSDSLELDLFFNNSDPLSNQAAGNSPIIPRVKTPRGPSNNKKTTPSPAGKGALRFEPHTSSTSGERTLPIVTPVHVEPRYKLDAFHTYPNQDKDVTTEAVFSHIIADLNRILDTTTRFPLI